MDLIEGCEVCPEASNELSEWAGVTLYLFDIHTAKDDKR
jgi:hypothetical protein